VEGLSYLRTPVQDIATSSLPPESRARAGTMSFRKNTILMNRPAPLPAWTPSTSASSGPWASNLTVGARKLWRPSGRAWLRKSLASLPSASAIGVAHWSVHVLLQWKRPPHPSVQASPQWQRALRRSARMLLQS